MQHNNSQASSTTAHRASSTAASPKASATPEERFGEAVQSARTQQRISQRKFAELLTERGMPVDASAVSRIESGVRSVRLVEAMAIAEVLGTSLEWLTRGAKSPSQQLQALRQREMLAMHGLEDPLVDLGVVMNEVQDFLREHPDLKQDVVSPSGVALDDVDRYFEWSAIAVAEEWTSWTRYFGVDTEGDREAFVRMVTAIARCYPVPIDEADGDPSGEGEAVDGDGVNPEEA